MTWPTGTPSVVSHFIAVSFSVMIADPVIMHRMPFTALGRAPESGVGEDMAPP